jgi:hypothetical protein
MRLTEIDNQSGQGRYTRGSTLVHCVCTYAVLLVFLSLVFRYLYVPVDNETPVAAIAVLYIAPLIPCLMIYRRRMKASADK